jgi:hypothetical protein
MMIDAESALETARTWGIALLCTAIAGTGYLLTGVIGRAVSPWATRRAGP